MRMLKPAPDPLLTPRERLRFASYLAVMGLLVLAACSSCAAMSSHVRTPVQQHNAAVEIRIACLGLAGDDPGLSMYHGSGVIIDGHRILTAAHVVTCHEGVMVKLTVNPGEGKEYEATVDRLVDGVDVARISVKENLAEYFSPVVIGPRPQLGDTVCTASAVPRVIWRCGLVQVPDADGLIKLDMVVEHGQSGSALYDSKGRLVGIVVQWFPTEGGEHHGGKAEPLDRSWLL